MLANRYFKSLFTMNETDSRTSKNKTKIYCSFCLSLFTMTVMYLIVDIVFDKVYNTTLNTTIHNQN